MYRQVIIPDKNNHSVELPKELFGKKIEVTMVEISETNSTTERPMPPLGKKVSPNELLETFGADPDYPSIDELRSKAWPSKW